MTDQFFLEEPEATELEIRGTTFKFYPMSVRAHTKLKSLAKPIASALSSLFSDNKTDVGRRVESFVNEKDEQGFEKTHIEPITPELAKFRSEQKEKAFLNLTDAILDETNLKNAVYIILDSLRMDVSEKSVNAQVEKLDSAALIELLKGVIKANKQVFGPLALKVTDAMNSISRTPPQEVSPASPTVAGDQRS